MKTCVLCPATIKPHHRLCYPCYQKYKHNMHEPWFKELEIMQLRQDKIDTQESFPLYAVALSSNGTETHLKKSVGRPGTSWIKVNKVLDIYDKSVDAGKPLSLRKLERAVNGEVKYLVIRKILMKYRSHVYKK